MALKDKTTLSADKNTSLPDNTIGDIEPVDVRDTFQDLIDSTLNVATSAVQQNVDAPVNFTNGVLINGANIQESMQLVLLAESTATQTPSSTDTPLQVTFGAAQGTVSDPVMIDASGDITFNEDGIYFIATQFSYGRAGTGGVSKVVTAFLEDSVYAGAVNCVLIDSLDSRFSFNSSSFAEITAGTLYQFEIIRDSSGHNSGGLFSFNPVLAGIPDVPSAKLSIFKLEAK